MYSLRRQASHSVNHPRSGNRAPDVHVKRTIDRVTRDSFGRGRLLGAVTLKWRPGRRSENQRGDMFSSAFASHLQTSWFQGNHDETNAG